MSQPLSDRLSEAILQALDDLQACEADPIYHVDMSYWHMPVTDAATQLRYCRVCLGGAVMAQRMKAPPERHLEPGYFCDEDYRKLRALDLVRVGDIAEALEELGHDVPDEVEDSWDVPGYSQYPVEFAEELREISKHLAEFGF